MDRSDCIFYEKLMDFLYPKTRKSGSVHLIGWVLNCDNLLIVIHGHLDYFTIFGKQGRWLDTERKEEKQGDTEFLVYYMMNEERVEAFAHEGLKSIKKNLS